MPFLWLGSTYAPSSHGKVARGTFVHAHRNVICIGFRHAHPYLNGSIGNNSFCCAANAQFSISSSWWSTAQPRINFFCRGGKSPSIGSASSILTSISSPPYSTWKLSASHFSFRISLTPALARPKHLHYTPSPVRKQAGIQSLRNRETLAGVILNHAPPRWRRTQSAAAFHSECHWGLAGRPLEISFSGGRTKTPRTPKTPMTVAG